MRRSSSLSKTYISLVLCGLVCQPAAGFLLPGLLMARKASSSPPIRPMGLAPLKSVTSVPTLGIAPPELLSNTGLPLSSELEAPLGTAPLFTLPRWERTYKILESVEHSDEAGGAGSGLSVTTFQRMEKAWEMVKNMPTGKEAGPAPCVSCGELVKQGVITEKDLEDSIGTEFNPVRVGFLADDGVPFELFTEDVLNLGVSPAFLIERATERFLDAGGVIKEHTAISGITVHSNGAALHAPGKNITSRLVIDSMGHQSPITRQCRSGEKPDGICMVVGSCASGFDPHKNKHADLLFSNTPILDKGNSSLQYFWEAFPASSGPTDRTTYMFTYFDADPRGPKLVDVVEDYWDLLGPYQGVSLTQLTFKRVLCGFFPTYRQSPLKTRFDRICSIGDASGMQSPLSFGGFGALTRHLSRLSKAFSEALATDSLSRANLRLINGYQPNLSATWLFQRSMGVRVGSNFHKDPHFINRILAKNFRAFLDLGDAVLKPFLQDVVQLVPLSKAMVKVALMDPLGMPLILKHVGVPAFIGWLRHFFMLAAYTLMHHVSKAIRLHAIIKKGRLSYLWNRHRERWEYGAGLDYTHVATA